jgi:hypothetical protein
VAASALVILLCVALDGSGGTTAAPVTFEERDVARVARRVEALRGLRFERPVRPLFLDREEALEFVERVTRSEYPESERRVDEEGLKLLGLIARPTDLRAALARVNEEQLLGFYDDRSKRLVVIRDPGVTRTLLEVTLAHELVHALEDQRFGLDVPEGVPDDSVLAESALAEGTATAVMVDYAERHLSLGEALELAQLPEGEGLPPYLEKLLLFPYLQGERFVAAFRDDGGGWRAVDSIYRFRRPRSSEQILHPRRFAVGERPERVRVPDLAGVLGPGWRRLRATALGEYDLRLLIDLGGGTRPAAGAEGWAGGRYELWRKGGLDEECPAPCIPRDLALVRVRWDSARDRAQAERQLARVWEQGLRGRRLGGGAGTGAGAWASRGGAIVMRGRGRETTVVLAPDAALAARVLTRTR